MNKQSCFITTGKLKIGYRRIKQKPLAPQKESLVQILHTNRDNIIAK